MRRRHTRESIIQTLRSRASELGKDTLAKSDLQGVLAASSVNYHFGSLGAALEAAGLAPGDSAAHLRQRGPVLSDADLFLSILELEASLGHEPGHNDYNARGKYSTKPFRDRFGTWKDVLAYYRKWRSENPSFAAATRDSTPQRPLAPGAAGSARDSDAASLGAAAPAERCGQAGPLYGAPMDFRGLRNAPINEQGVVYLFGMVSRELGFMVESLSQGFPDCEAKYLRDSKKGLWGRARIEFEFRSSGFREHGHDPMQCEFIVCWEHDWPECPVRVVELRSEIRRLPSK